LEVHLIGETLSHFRVTSRLGAGGMGEVYRATDTHLGRDVAIKMLPADLARDPARLSRFRREAHLLASLNHPHIAAVYGLEEVGGMPFLILELVEGEDLAERLSRGPLSVEEALEIARQIAEALEEAHEKGIIHRDLKPANVKVTPENKVKVLDFGLAKLLDPPEADGPTGRAGTMPDPSHSPTLSHHGTAMGVILGTAAYMSPEQTRGRPVDKRADIWAFGVVLYEMLTGKQLFSGEFVSDTLAAVLTREPDWGSLPSALPRRISELLRRCLQRDPRSRLRDIGDARLEILAATSDTDPSASGLAVRERSGAWRRTGLVALVALILGAGTTTLIFLAGRTPVSAPSISRLSIPLPSDAPFFREAYPNLGIAISRDGSRVVYCSRDKTARLYLRELGSLEVTAIPGTEGAHQPFFSPDGEWVAFFTQSGLLKRISLAGGSPITIASELPNSYFVVGTWTDDDRIVFDTWNGGLRVVPADGGPVQTLTSPASEWHQDPHAPPGTSTVLYFVITDTTPRIEAISLDGGKPTPILENASHPRYLSSGHLLFTREGNLMVAPFDAERLRLTGPAASVPLNVMVDNPGAAAPLPQLAVSGSGTLVYARRRREPKEPSTFLWVDRAGIAEEVATVPIQRPAFVSLSPNGQRVAVASRAGPRIEINIYDLASNTLTKLAEHSLDFPSAAIWSPDGRQVIFARYDTHQGEVVSQVLDSGLPADTLVSMPGSFFSVGSLSADGRFLLFSATDPKTNADTWVLDLGEPAGKRAPRPFANTSANEVAAAISPDDRWVAYASDESGTYEVYLRRFPGGESKRRVSTRGGMSPHWSIDGRQLFFQADYGEKMMVASVTTESELTVSEPRLLFEGHYEFATDAGAAYAVASDGRFLMIKGELSGIAHELTVVQNWLAEIERLAPRAR
jgi:serine/threonine-protein kinase